LWKPFLCAICANAAFLRAGDRVRGDESRNVLSERLARGSNHVALRAAGINPPVLGTDAVADVRDIGSPGEFSDVRFAAFFDPNRAATAEQRGFLQEYERRFSGTPNHQAALSYDAAMLIGRAVHAVGGNRRKVRDWIAQVGRGAPSHPGVSGAIRFDEHGDVVNKVVVVGRAGP
jgi:branched-chain amino acid transport system substrate-binding protein